MPKKTFQLRQEIAASKQGSNRTDLDRLRQLVPELPGHPYQLYDASSPMSDKIHSGLLRDEGYTTGCKSLSVASPKRYLYRIACFDSILRMLEPVGKNIEPNLVSRTETESLKLFDPVGRSKSESFRLLCEMSGKGYLQLGKHVDGTLKLARSGTWWTSHRIDSAEVYTQRLLLGLCNTLIRPVVLKLDVHALNHAVSDKAPSTGSTIVDFKRTTSIPLEVDAFDYPVFCAQKLDPSTKSGRTIDLRSFPDLQVGVDEYIIHNVPAEFVQIKPSKYALDDCDIEEEIELRMKIDTRDTSFWTSLHLFYEKDMEEELST